MSFLNACYFLNVSSLLAFPQKIFFLRSKWENSYYYLRMDFTYGLTIFVCFDFL